MSPNYKKGTEVSGGSEAKIYYERVGMKVVLCDISISLNKIEMLPLQKKIDYDLE